MEYYGVLPTLDKNYILSKVTQEQIFEKYLGVSVDTTNLIISPLRHSDKNPTCSFYYSNNGKLRFKDWAGYFHGDCFDIVGYINQVDSKSKKGFGVILDQIARDFRLHKYSDIKIESGTTFDVREITEIKVKKVTLIEFQGRNWTKQDADFWTAGNINKKLLELGRVYPCLYIWINKNLIYNYNPKDPAFAYYFTSDKIKVYFPLRKNYRFIGNTSYLQGIDLIQPDRFGVITKSYKDVLSMKTFGIQAVAPSSESTLVTEDEWMILKNNFDYILVLMDFDRQGVVMANKLRKLYPVKVLFFGSIHFPKFSNKNYKIFTNVKDFYDFVKFYGKEATIKLIEETKEYLDNEIDKTNKEIFNT